MEESGAALVLQAVLREEEIFLANESRFQSIKNKPQIFPVPLEGRLPRKWWLRVFCYVHLGLNMTGNSGIWAGVAKVTMEIHDVMLDRACQDS